MGICLIYIMTVPPKDYQAENTKEMKLHGGKQNAMLANDKIYGHL